MSRTPEEAAWNEKLIADFIRLRLDSKTYAWTKRKAG